MKRLYMVTLAVTAIGLLSVGGLAADAATNRMQTAKVKLASVQKNTASTWFLHDVQLAERAKLKVGSNYMLNYGETNGPLSLQMSQIWLGVPTSQSKDPFFGYSWDGVFNSVKTQPLSLSSINVLEQVRQNGNTVGVLVPATSDSIGNGDYIAFAKGQVITTADKSGELFYTVYPLKSVSVPFAKQSGSSSNTQVNGESSSASGTLMHINHDDYLRAVSTIDKFLSAWQNNDAKAGIALLTPYAKKDKTAAQLTTYFASNNNPAHAGYEVVGFQAIGGNAFEFHVWMYGTVPGLYGPGNTWSRPQPETVTVIREKRTWYVNNLPRY